MRHPFQCRAENARPLSSPSSPRRCQADSQRQPGRHARPSRRRHSSAMAAAWARSVVGGTSTHTTADAGDAMDGNAAAAAAAACRTCVRSASSRTSRANAARTVAGVMAAIDAAAAAAAARADATEVREARIAAADPEASAVVAEAVAVWSDAELLDHAVGVTAQSSGPNEAEARRRPRHARARGRPTRSWSDTPVAGDVPTAAVKPHNLGRWVRALGDCHWLLWLQKIVHVHARLTATVCCQACVANRRTRTSWTQTSMLVRSVESRLRLAWCVKSLLSQKRPRSPASDSSQPGRTCHHPLPSLAGLSSPADRPP